MRTTKMPEWVRGQKHPAISILTVAVVVLALLIVAMSRTVGTEATGNTGVWIERWNETMQR